MPRTVIWSGTWSEAVMINTSEGRRPLDFTIAERAAADLTPLNR
jgi:hypothetical protein